MTLSQITTIVLPYFWFKGLQYLLQTRYSIKMSQNFVAASHAIGASILSFGYLSSINPYFYSTLVSYSTGYFIYDFIYCLRHLKNTNLKWAFLYHHIASVYIINMPAKYCGPLILFWAELSNIPSYPVYYYLKKGETLSVNLWKKRQLFAYICIRIPVLGYLLYTNLSTIPDPHILYPIIPVYIMGIVWSLKLLRGWYSP